MTTDAAGEPAPSAGAGQAGWARKLGGWLARWWLRAPAGRMYRRRWADVLVAAAGLGVVVVCGVPVANPAGRRHRCGPVPPDQSLAEGLYPPMWTVQLSGVIGALPRGRRGPPTNQSRPPPQRRSRQRTAPDIPICAPGPVMTARCGALTRRTDRPWLDRLLPLRPLAVFGFWPDERGAQPGEHSAGGACASARGLVNGNAKMEFPRLQLKHD